MPGLKLFLPTHRRLQPGADGWQLGQPDPGLAGGMALNIEHEVLLALSDIEDAEVEFVEEHISRPALRHG